MQLISIDKIAPVCIARLADGGADRIAFDISPWRRRYPMLTRYRIEATSPGGVVYIPVTELTHDALIWPIRDTDTGAVGTGKYHIVAEGENGARKTSAWAVFTVNDIMPGAAGDEPPDPAKPWTDRAAEAAARAENAAVHPPVIGENGHWLLWDFAAGAYTDSGVKARGDDAPAESVLFIPQTLDAGQQAQARANIGAQADGCIPTQEEVLQLLCDADLLPAMTDADGAVLADAEGVLLI